MAPVDREAPVKEGEILAAKYRVERILGAGGMGVVVAAQHIQLEQRVALKFVHPEALEDAAALERFLREARLAVKLKSEHVAKVLDVGTMESGAPYMVMEYLDGQNLGEVLQSRGPLGVEVAADYIVQACEALSEAHAMGIVHRDLKPQNLFLTKGVGGAPLVKVLDFGISKLLKPAPGSGNLTQTSAVMGSPLYMAPEQLRSSRDVDARADIWALGVVLYELLSGRLPFEAESLTALTLKIAQDPYVPLDQARANLPPGIVAIVARCLEKPREGRYPDASSLAEALAEFAPLASRVSVHRARMVSGAFQETLSSQPPAPIGAGSQPRVPANTPPPWAGTGNAPPKGARTLAVAAALAAVVGIAIGAVMYASRGSAPGSNGSTASSAAPASAPPPPAPPLPPPTPAPSPPQPLTPSLTPTPSPALSPTPTLPPPPSASSAAHPAAHPAPHPAKPAASAPGANRDDDIPSLR